MSLPDRLRAIVGAAHVITDPAAMAPYLLDWRKRYQGAAQAVVRPATTAEVAGVVAACAHARVPVVPQGGNTGLVGGATPSPTGEAVVVSLARLNRVRAVDTANDTITVEAGCILKNVQEVARQHGRLFPLSLAAEGSATIGGNLSTNAGGTQVLRYGNARELTLGLEVVLADGTIWSGLRALRKDNTGYDLKHLFIGAEGTLGIITAATLKLFPLPRAQATALAALPSLQAAVSLLEAARADAGSTLTAFEVMGVNCLTRTVAELPRLRMPLPADQPWYALLEISDHEGEAHATALLEAILTEASAAGHVKDAVIARSLAESQALWALREGIPEAHARAGGNVKHDISLPVSEIPAFVAETHAALAARFPWTEPAVFGHLGDGNLHYNIGTQPGTPIAVAFEHEAEINRIVYEAVAARGGSISAEHGIGQLKQGLLPAYKPTVELALMRRIKQALDPYNVMNPGKIL
ncbi:MAG: FAD-binding oxidoreductase [Sutterellaceae bacterium]|nr:FAD-binding oxidoreductase [Burkholderiaceae bacterium]MCX7901353.1 FAD-binding oxidoreductase [Burkholderiaceae bacterium]MDW8429439.1 FAD-binding oxidoreductase [Sutterellaceae bacterium]